MKLALLFLLCAQTQQPMSFKVPDGAKEEQIQATAKAISKRISEYGYRDMKVSPSADGKLVQIFSEAPLNNAVRAKLYLLCTVPAKETEIRFVYPMTDAEVEQFRPGEASPKGAKWVKWKGGWILLRESPSYSPVVKWSPRKSDGVYDQRIMDAAHLTFDESVSKALNSIPKEVVVKLRLFIDGEMVDLGGNIYPEGKFFRWTISRLDGWDTLGVCVNNPIPLKLSH